MMKMSKLLGLLLLSAMLAACAVNESVRVESDGGSKQTEVLESDSGFLSARLEIIDTKVAKTAGDLLRIQASLKNSSSQTLVFKYKVKWFDKDGFEVAVGGRPWTPAKITPAEVLNVQAIAPNDTVESFSVQVQD